LAGVTDHGHDADLSEGRLSYRITCTHIHERRNSQESEARSDLDEVSITFNDSPSLNIIECTSGCTSLCGAIGGDARFLDWIDDEDAFIRYIQLVGNYFLGIPQFEGHLILRPPLADRAGIEYVIKEVTLAGVTDCGHDIPLTAGRLTYRVTLAHIQQRRNSRKRGKSKKVRRQFI